MNTTRQVAVPGVGQAARSVDSDGGLQSGSGEEDTLWSLLDGVSDPEIPVISIRELGVLRNIGVSSEGGVVVTITPTYSGCPAMDEIATDIRSVLNAAGYQDAEVKHQLAPAWTTEWMSAEGMQKLLEYGIAPPNACANSGGENRPAACPQCGSADVKKISEFGSTACKAMYQCSECLEPFDYFKCL